jgi:3',5'-cyclic AMP phosphodiesterase CpdA
MTFSLLHLSDPHFGRFAHLEQIAAVEELVPDLEPDVSVLSGDLTQRARHGELQAAKAFVRELERTAPVLVIPGNHEVQWWWRPFIPFSGGAKYGKYKRYFGPVLAPSLRLPEAVIAAVLTAHGMAWGSLTWNPQDIATKGHLPKGEIGRARQLFAQADPSQARVLIVHHNVLRGERSQRMGLARWRQAQRRVVRSGAELVLCGHDHQECAELLANRVVVSCAGTLSARLRGARSSVFHRISIDDRSINVELYRWDGDRRVFRQSDIHAFARGRESNEAAVATVAG